MEDELIIDTIVSGMEVYFRCFALSDSIIHHDGDVEWIIPSPSNNGPAIIYKAVLTNENASQTIEEIIFGIQEGRIPAWWVITPTSSPENLKEILLSKGFHCLGDDEPGMAIIMQDAPIWPEIQQGVVINRVQSIEEFHLWVDVVNKALHGWNLLIPEQYYSWLTSENIDLYLAYLDGEPAATSATILDGSCGSLEFVSTLEEYRNRGMGTAVSVAALRGLQEKDIQVATLRACHSAIGLYEKLGFQIYYNQIIMQFKVDERNDDK